MARFIITSQSFQDWYNLGLGNIVSRGIPSFFEAQKVCEKFNNPNKEEK